MTDRGNAPSERRAAGIIDAHLHLQPWHLLKQGPKDMMAAGRDPARILAFLQDRDAFLAHLDEAGIAAACLINYVSTTMGFTEEVNGWIGGYCAGAEDRLFAVGSVDPSSRRDPRGAVRRLRDAGVRGIKIHPPHQGVAANAYVHDPFHPLAQVYEEAQASGMPLFVHTGTSVFPGARSRLGNPMDVDDIAVDFPELTIVIAHIGRPLWYEEALFLLRRHPRVVGDLSSIPPRRIPQVFPRLAEFADRLLWGSDWPAPGVPELPAIAASIRDAIPAAVQDPILRDNPRRLFFSRT